MNRAELSQRVSVLQRLGPIVWFDSAKPGPEALYSFIIVNPEPCLRWSQGDCTEPFARLRSEIDKLDVAEYAHYPFVGGLIGWIGYEVRHAIESLPGRPRAVGDLPDLWLAHARHVIGIDHERAQSVLFYYNPTGILRPEDARLQQEIVSVWNYPDARPLSDVALSVVSPDPAEHWARVAAAIEAIRAGEIYQANLGQRWSAPQACDPLTLYGRLRQGNPPAQGFFADIPGEGAIMSVSPESFLSVRKGRVRTRPIKGTAPRSLDPAEDKANAEALEASTKDRAELAMIVDVLRNDLSRVARVGSVQVTKPLVLESHPTVHHLVAEIEAELAPGRDLVDLLRATFPGGSITGAPRIRAMEIIDQLEDFRRGIWCGSALWIGGDGSMDSNILIRTIHTEGDRYVFAGGGGITVRSDPVLEERECQQKVRALLEAISGSNLQQRARSPTGRK